jgi:hypothetical protein
MTVTDENPTVTCCYCNGGTVYGGAYSARKQCLVCGGTNRITPLPCDLCGRPRLDHETVVYSINGRYVLPSRLPVHLDCVPVTPDGDAITTGPVVT